MSDVELPFSFSEIQKFPRTKKCRLSIKTALWYIGATLRDSKVCGAERFFSPVEVDVLFQKTETTISFEKFDVPSDVEERIIECKNNEVMLLFVGLTFSDSPVGHANALFADMNARSVERFEPHGEFVSDPKNVVIDRALRLFTRTYFKGFQYIPTLSFCPQLGPQHVERLPVECYKGGFCVAFALLYLHLRVLNPDSERSEIVRVMVDLTKHDYSDYILRYIEAVELAATGRRIPVGISSLSSIDNFIDGVSFDKLIGLIKTHASQAKISLSSLIASLELWAVRRSQMKVVEDLRQRFEEEGLLEEIKEYRIRVASVLFEVYNPDVYTEEEWEEAMESGATEMDINYEIVIIKESTTVEDVVNKIFYDVIPSRWDIDFFWSREEAEVYLMDRLDEKETFDTAGVVVWQSGELVYPEHTPVTNLVDVEGQMEMASAARSKKFILDD